MSEQNNTEPTTAEFTDHEVRFGLRMSIAASALGVLHYQLLWPTTWLVVGLLTMLGITKTGIAIVAAAFPLARFTEVIAAYAMQRTGRRREVFTWTLICSRLLWIPLLLAYFIRGDLIGLRAPVVFAILFLSGLLAWLGSNAWLSWMGDFVPSEVRGRYFGIRQVCEVATSITAGWVVAWYLGKDPTYSQYVLVVCVLVAFGIADILVFRYLVPHPVLKPTHKRGRLADFLLLPLRNRRYRRVVVFFGVWNFASALMQPYMPIYINDKAYLALSYLFIATVVAVGGIVRGAVSFSWGHLGDHWGPKRVLNLCVLISVTPPFYYLLVTPGAEGPISTWPIYLAWIVGSIAWSGIIVFTLQFSISMAPKENRSIYLAFQSALVGLVVAAGYLASAGIVKLLSCFSLPWGFCDLQILFCLAGIGRLLSFIPLSRIEDSHRPEAG